MYLGKNLFAQLMDFLPWTTFNRAHSQPLERRPDARPGQPSGARERRSPTWHKYDQCEEIRVKRMVCFKWSLRPAQDRALRQPGIHQSNSTPSGMMRALNYPGVHEKALKIQKENQHDKQGEF